MKNPDTMILIMLSALAYQTSPVKGRERVENEDGKEAIVHPGLTPDQGLWVFLNVRRRLNCEKNGLNDNDDEDDGLGGTIYQFFLRWDVRVQ